MFDRVVVVTGGRDYADAIAVGDSLDIEAKISGNLLYKHDSIRVDVEY